MYSCHFLTKGFSLGSVHVYVCVCVLVGGRGMTKFGSSLHLSMNVHVQIVQSVMDHLKVSNLGVEFAVNPYHYFLSDSFIFLLKTSSQGQAGRE